MTPERLNSWIYRPVTGARTLTLVHQPLLGQETTIATWTREDVEMQRDQNGSQGQDVLDSAREHMELSQERDTCKFVLAWFSERSTNPLKSMILKLKPENDNALATEGDSALAAHGGGALVQLVPVFLNHISHTQRATIGSLGVLLAAHERTANAQQKIIDGQQAVIEKLLERVDALASDGKGRTDSPGVAEAKARALDKLTSALPELVSAGVHIAAGKLGPPPQPPRRTREQLKAAAREAIGELHPEEIAELVSEPEPENDNGAAIDEPQH